MALVRLAIGDCGAVTGSSDLAFMPSGHSKKPREESDSLSLSGNDEAGIKARCLGSADWADASTGGCATGALAEIARAGGFVTKLAAWPA